MRSERDRRWSRREFVAGAALAGTAALVGLRLPGLTGYPHLVGQTATAAEAPPETTTIRITQSPVICIAPQYLAENFLRQEGFTDVQYVTPKPPVTPPAVASGKADIAMGAAPAWAAQADQDDNFVLLAGVHTGCYELFGTESIRSIRDLKGKTVAVPGALGGHHLIAAAMAAYVGLDPRKDIRWVVHRTSAQSIELLAQGKIDAYIGWPPDPQELRARKIGHVLVNMMRDPPWSQYFCCIVGVNRDFYKNYPVATKRALRAILKAADVCAREPERVARFLVDKGYTSRFDYALQALKELPYETWRTYDPEDSVRFYALRLQEAGMIKSSPQRIIARNTDWRLLKELKTELKSRGAIPGGMHHEHHRG